MNIKCPNCQNEIKMSIPVIPPNGVKIKCPSCREFFQYTGEELDSNDNELDPNDFDDLEWNEESEPSEEESPSALDGLADFVSEIEEMTEDAPPSSTPSEEQENIDPLAGLVAELELMTNDEDDDDDDETSYYVKRSEDKIFGPFNVSTIQNMLEKGQLSGQEELSPDGDFWSPMVDWSEFRDLLLSKGLNAVTTQNNQATPEKKEEPSTFQARPVQPTQADVEEWDIEDLKEEASSVRATKTQTKKTTPNPFASQAQTNSDGVTVTFEEPSTPISPPTRVSQGVIRSALKQEVLEKEIADSEKKLPKPVIYGGIGIVVLIIVAIVFYLLQPGEMKKLQLVTNQNKAFQQDTYKKYTRQLLPKFRRQALRYPKNVNAQIYYAIALATILENYHPQRKFKKILKKIIAKLPPKQKEIPYSPIRKKLNALYELSKKHTRIPLAWSKTIPKSSPDYNLALYVKAKTSYLRKHFKSAIKIISQLLQKSPQHTRAHYLKGLSFLRLKQWDSAFDAFYKATLSSSAHLPSYLFLLEIENKVPKQKIRYQVLKKTAQTIFSKTKHYHLKSLYYQILAKKAEQQKDYAQTNKWLSLALKYNPRNYKLLRKRPLIIFLSRAYAQEQKTLLKMTVHRNVTAAQFYLRVLYRLQNWSAAQEWFLVHFKKYKKDPTINYLRGLIQYTQQRLPLAINNLDKSIELSLNKHLPARLLIAIILWEKNKKDKALKIWKKIQKEELDNHKIPTKKDKKAHKKAKLPYWQLDLDMLKIKMLQLLGKKTETFALLQKLHKLYNNDEQINNLLGSELLSQQKYEQAKQYLEKTLKIFPKNLNSLKGLALIYEQTASLKQAIKYYQQCVKIDNRNADLYFRLGRAYFAVKQYKKALSSLTSAQNLDNKIAAIYYYKARIYQHDKESPQRIQNAYEKAIELAPTKRIYLYRLAHFLTKQTKMQEALRIYTRLLRNRKQSKKEKAEVLFERGKLFLDVNMARQALRDFKKVYRMQKQTPKLMQYLGDANNSLKRSSRAIRWYKRYLRLLRKRYRSDITPIEKRKLRLTQSVIYGKLGQIFQDRNRRKQAIRAYKQAIRYNKKAFSYYRNLGYLYKDHKRWGSCIRAFSKFLRKAPPRHMDRREVQYDLRACRQAQFGQ